VPVLDLTGLLDVFTAPIDQQQPLALRSECASGAGSVPAAAAQPPDMMAAA
jgi:hypothetical protein